MTAFLLSLLLRRYFWCFSPTLPVSCPGTTPSPLFPFQRRRDDDYDVDTTRDGDDERGEDMKIDGDDSDDDVSLVSRSPSPVAQDQMDIDKYDDYVRGPVREVITVDTKIKSTNKGFKMLSKLGWVEGQPLGLSQDGVLSPLNHSAEAV
jgi:G-patch domain